MAITVQQVYNSFARLKKDVSDVPLATFYEWCDWTNKDLYRRLSSVDSERFISEYTYTNPTETSYALPTDFNMMDVWGTGVYFYDSVQGKITEMRLPVTGVGSATLGYYIRGSSIYFTGSQQGTQTYIMRYLPNPTEIDGLTDYFTLDTTSVGKKIVEDEFLQVLVAAIDVLYCQWDEDANAEIYADQRYARLLSEMEGNTRRTPAVFGITSSSNYF